MDSDDKKITQLARVTSLSDSDLFVVVVNVGTAPQTKAIVKSDLGVSGSTLAIAGCELIWNSATSLSVGTGLCIAENGDEIDIISPLTASSLSLSNSTFHHVYAYLSGGSPAMEVVTTAPVAWKGTAYSKTGDTSRRYIGSVLTDGSGNVRRFKHDPITNTILYVNAAITSAPYRVLSDQKATSATSVSMTGIVPVTVTYALVRMTNLDTTYAAYVGVATLTTSAYDESIGTGVRIFRSIALESQATYYIYAGAPADGLYIDVPGYIYKR